MGKYQLRNAKTITNPNSEENEEMATGDVEKGEANVHAMMDALRASMDAIRADIKAGHVDMKKELSGFCETIKKDMKEELGNFKEEVNQKLGEIGADLKNTEARMEEVETRVAEVEEWSVSAKDMLLQALKEQERIVSKLTDLETRSRRNNLRIFGIPEGEEGNNACEFLEKFIKSELQLPDIDLKIQRCHRSLGPKPPPQAAPRSMVAYFLVYKTKDLVLSTAWKKKEIHLNGKRVYFDHDYPTEVIKKRKEYAPLRKVLKEQGLRFQTPAPAKLRVFYEDGPTIYSNAGEATEDMLKRGILTADDGTEEGNTHADASQTAVTPRKKLERNKWQTSGSPRRRNRPTDIERAREKLRRFQRAITQQENTT